MFIHILNQNFMTDKRLKCLSIELSDTNNF